MERGNHFVIWHVGKGPYEVDDGSECLCVLGTIWDTSATVLEATERYLKWRAWRESARAAARQPGSGASPPSGGGLAPSPRP